MRKTKNCKQCKQPNKRFGGPSIICTDCRQTNSDNKQKFCRKCQQIKPLAEFVKGDARRDGKVSLCIACSRRPSKLCVQCGVARPLSQFISSRPQCKYCDWQNGVKQCNRCKQIKKSTEFHLAASRPSGTSPYCKPCVSKYNSSAMPAWRRKRKYSLSVDTYEAMLAAQHGTCAICRNPPTHKRLGKIGPLHVDHDHHRDDNAVRGLLCPDCNLGLGRFKDNPRLLRRAAKYLERAKCQSTSGD
jgi:hypothetical protein